MPRTPIPVGVKLPLGDDRQDIIAVVVNEASLDASRHNMPMPVNRGVYRSVGRGMYSVKSSANGSRDRLYVGPGFRHGTRVSLNFGEFHLYGSTT